MKTTLAYWLDSLRQLAYPEICVGCAERNAASKSMLCMICEGNLTTTFHHQSVANDFTDRFEGRVPLQCGAALFYFKPDGPVQYILHRFKYAYRPDIGHRMGARLGARLREGVGFEGIDGIVPVPLHPIKRHRRGYNQSEELAIGIGSELHDAPVVHALSRRIYTETQTKKTKLERYANVAEAFEVRDAQQHRGKHYLLVDDVLTTGATLETCALRLLEAVPDLRISMATLAMATTGVDM